MTTTASHLEVSQTETHTFSLSKILPFVGLGFIILLALILRIYQLNSIGDANRYYTAAVESMLQSPHNFFFVSAEPGGSVTVDKPPLGLWFQAISAAFFGVNGVAVALPQILSGILSIPLLYWLVKRWWGVVAGLMAAFVLAVTPVAIAAERNNTMDATLIFFLLLATWAFIVATERGKLWHLLLGATLVGLAFNIKMMQAFLPLPAFYTLYFFGAKLGWLRKIAYLGLATVVLVGVSLSWAVAVDLVPADQRPYIGSSENNTVMELIFGHNGLNRLSQETPTDGAGQGNVPNALPDGNGNFAPPDGAGTLPPNAGNNGGSGGGAFSFEVGEAGLFRLFTAPLSNEVSWLLPFGLFVIGLLILSTRIHFPLSIAHQSAVLWGGWLLTASVFFTIADFFHAYYMAMLGAPLAALVGIGIARLWQLREKRTLIAGILLTFASLGTVTYQYYAVSEYINDAWWFALVVSALVAGLALLWWGTLRALPRYALAGFAGIVLALAITPTVWSGLTTLDENFSVNLPHAYAGENQDQQQAPTNSARNINTELLDYLQENTQNTTYLIAVSSAQQGAPYVLETGRPVLYMGGFNGSDPVVDASDMAELVADSELRYVLWSPSNGPGGGGNQAISTWLSESCSVVDDIELGQENLPAPPNFGNGQAPPQGPPNGGGGFGGPPGRNQRTALYDCAS